MNADTKNKVKLAILMLAAILPITFATVSFRNAMEDADFGGDLNKGVLISVLGLNDADGQPMFRPFEDIIAELASDAEYEIQPWLMVYVSASDCTEACLSKIYELRQLHVALGKDIQRVRRYFVNASTNGISEENRIKFRDEYPSMGVAYGNYDNIRQNLALNGASLNPVGEDYVLFVDPVGNVMMFYSADKTAQDIMSDLETLLKHSSLG
jgi:hypothetical protein